MTNEIPFCNIPGPCYRGNILNGSSHDVCKLILFILGICLPRNIIELFPESTHTGTYVSRCIHCYDPLESKNVSAISVLTKNLYELDDEEHAHCAPDESQATTSTSDLSTSHRRVRKKPVTTAVDPANLATEAAAVVSWACPFVTIEMHNKNNCVICCRAKVINKIVDMTLLNIQEPKDLAMQNGKIRDSDFSFYSPESIISDDSANTNMPDRITNLILRNVQKMANPIMFKACRKILMELKQKYPQSFQDICLYSEICKYVSQCSYRLMARRFIQEIFLDLSFDAFSSGVELILDVAQQRVSDFDLLNNSRMLPLSPPLPTPPPTNVPQQSASVSLHKLHSLKSPLLASVYETSVENLMDSPPRVTKDEVDAIVTLRSPQKTTKMSPGGSTQVTAEVHPQRRSMESGAEVLEPIRRRRFNTLELDLSCTINKFPIKHRSPTSTTGPTATSTRRPVSLNVNKEAQMPLYKSGISTSDHSFEASSRRQISSPISPPLGTLFCEQRLLTSSRSEATLSNKKGDGKKGDDKIGKK